MLTRHIASLAILLSVTSAGTAQPNQKALTNADVTLTGTWYGGLRATHGDRSEVFGLYVQIEHDPSSPAPEPLTQLGTTLTATLQKGTLNDCHTTCRSLSRGRT
jgi:hypothetical protein